MTLQSISLAILLIASSLALSNVAAAESDDFDTVPPKMDQAKPAPANSIVPKIDQSEPARDTAEPKADQSVSPPTKAGEPKVDRSESVPSNTTGPKVIIDVNLSTQSMDVQFADGTQETWAISSGRPGYDTPDGRYKPQWVDPDHISKQYQDAPMPYAVFFDLKGHAFHGSYQKTFGRAESHGCIRLSVDNAKKLFDAVKASSAEITITGRAPRGGTTWARRHEHRSYAAARSYQYSYGRPAYGYPYVYAGRPYYQPQPFSFFGN